MAITLTSDISPMQSCYAHAKTLHRAIPYMVFEKFGQTFVVPNQSTKVAKFRRWDKLNATPNAISEGVTPDPKTMGVTDVTTTLVQYGDRSVFSDVILDTNDDATLNNSIDVLAEQAAEMIENVRFNVLKAGTNVYYANGSARNQVNTPLTLALQRKVTRFLKAQHARMITKVVASTAMFNTQNVAPSYVAVCHPNCESAVRDLPGFVDVKNYHTGSSWENEIGSCEGVRYLFSTIISPWEDAGGDYAGSSTAMISTTGVKADVYPILYFGRDAYGIVPLKGQSALTVMVVNPKSCDSDPMAQRGHVAWKSMQNCVILNQAWMVRAEVACVA